MLGFVTLLGWAAMLVVGPFASVQLWRLRKSGWWSATFLVGLAVLYYFLGAVLFRAPNAPLSSVLVAGGANLFFLVVLLSPQARNACSAAA